MSASQAEALDDLVATILIAAERLLDANNADDADDAKDDLDRGIKALKSYGLTQDFEAQMNKPNEPGYFRANND